MTASDELQVLRLPDGRRLAFAWYGPGDGVPCIVLSGMPGSRLAPAWAFPAGRWPNAECALWVSTGLATAAPIPTRR
jgi:hypothetical protein